MSKTKNQKVNQFKQFVKRHPELIKEVRKGNTTWQQLYEEWYFLGDDDQTWENYRTSSPNSKQTNKNSSTNEIDESKEKEVKASELFMQIMNYIKNLNMDQVQQHIEQINSLLESLQQFLTEINKENNGTDDNVYVNSGQGTSRNPFSFRKDRGM